MSKNQQHFFPDEQKASVRVDTNESGNFRPRASSVDLGSPTTPHIDPVTNRGYCRAKRCTEFASLNGGYCSRHQFLPRSSVGSLNDVVQLEELEEQSERKPRPRSLWASARIAVRFVIGSMNKFTTNGSKIDYNALSDNKAPVKKFRDLAVELPDDDKLDTMTAMYKSIKQLRALLAAAVNLSRDIHKDEALRQTMDIAHSVVEAEFITIFSVVDDMLSMEMSDNPKYFKDAVISKSMGLAGYVAEHGELQIVDECLRDSRFSPAYTDRMGYVPKNAICVPILNIAAEVVAILQIENKTAAEFSDDDAISLDFVAAIVGQTLENALLYEASVLQTKKTNALLSVIEHISSENDPASLMEKIIEAAYELVPAERHTLYVVDEHNGELICQDQLSIFEPPDLPELEPHDLPPLDYKHPSKKTKISRDSEAFRIPMTEGVIGQVVKTGRSVNIPDTSSDKLSRSVAMSTNLHSKNMLAVPVLSADSPSPIAVIQAVNRRGKKYFNRQDQKLLESLARSAGIILKKTRMFIDSVQRQRVTAAERDVMQAVSKETTVEVIIDRVVQIAYQILSAERVTLFFVDPIKEEMWCVVSKDAVGYSLPIGHGIAGHVAMTGEYVNINDAHLDPRFDPTLDRKTGFRTKSVICMPIIESQSGKEKNVIAVIQALNKNKGKSAFSTEDVSLLQSFCVEIGDTLRRYVTEALLQRTADDKGAQSLVQVYMNRPLSTFSARITLSKIEDESSDQFEYPPYLRTETRTLRSLQRMSFDCFQYKPEELITFARQILVDLGLVAEFNIPEEELRHFLVTVRQKYHDDNPFHNWYHAFSVMHFAYIFLMTTNAHKYLRKLDVLGMMIGALCHDIDHPGFTNSYAINSESVLAIKYNDTSVLENHHAFETFQILRNEKCNIFCNTSTSQKQELRKIMIKAILSTDMADHFDMCKKIENIDRKAPFKKSKPEERQLLINLITHSSDLSGQVVDNSISRQWEERICEEFQLQAKRERELGLDTAPFMQNLEDKGHRAHQQVNFIDFVLLPLWKPVTRIFDDLVICYTKLLKNRDYFDSIAKKERGIEPKRRQLNGHDEEKKSHISAVARVHKFKNSLSFKKRRSREAKEIEPKISVTLSPTSTSDMDSLTPNSARSSPPKSSTPKSSTPKSSPSKRRTWKGFIKRNSKSPQDDSPHSGRSSPSTKKEKRRKSRAKPMRFFGGRTKKHGKEKD